MRTKGLRRWAGVRAWQPTRRRVQSFRDRDAGSALRLGITLSVNYSHGQRAKFFESVGTCPAHRMYIVNDSPPCCLRFWVCCHCLHTHGHLSRSESRTVCHRHYTGEFYAADASSWVGRALNRSVSQAARVKERCHDIKVYTMAQFNLEPWWNDPPERVDPANSLRQRLGSLDHHLGAVTHNVWIS